MKKLTLAIQGTRTAMLYWLCWGAAFAATEIKRPGFVNTANAGNIEAAGGEIYTWLIAGLGIAFAIASLVPAWFFMQGEKEKAVDIAKNILIGAVFVVAFGGVVFAVIEAAR